MAGHIYWHLVSMSDHTLLHSLRHKCKSSAWHSVNMLVYFKSNQSEVTAGTNMVLTYITFNRRVWQHILRLDLDFFRTTFRLIKANICLVWCLICAMSYYRVFRAKRRHAKTRQMVTFSCFRMATFRPATRKYDTFHASPFRLLFVLSLPGRAKGRHAKTRKNHYLSCFRVATVRPEIYM